MEKAIKNKEVSPKFLKMIYIIIISFCLLIIITLSLLLILRVNKNNELKKQAEEIVERYRIEANEFNNKNDPDYAEIYFDGNVMYIPSEDIIIEYKP